MTEISDAVAFATGIFAAVLFAISLFAYKNTKARRLIFVSAAFGLFSIREIVARLDVYIPEIQLTTIEIVLAFLGFAILALFFIAIVMKK